MAPGLNQDGIGNRWSLGAGQRRKTYIPNSLRGPNQGLEAEPGGWRTEEQRKQISHQLALHRNVHCPESVPTLPSPTSLISISLETGGKAGRTLA